MFSLQPPRHIPTLPFASDRYAIRVGGMSAVPPIASEFVRCSKTALSAISGHQAFTDRPTPCSSGVPTGSFQDQPGDLVGLGYQRQVTRLYLDRLRAHALGHEAFEIGI
jgi:hypothetical protein